MYIFFEKSVEVSILGQKKEPFPHFGRNCPIFKVPSGTILKKSDKQIKRKVQMSILGPKLPISAILDTHKNFLYICGVVCSLCYL